jgi:hypothetical protein
MALAVLEARHEVVTEMRARLTLGTLEPVASEIARALLAHGALGRAGGEHRSVT